jgi:hypothetical protein
VRAAKSMGLNVCGVDMLRSNHGAVVMEVNSSPGLEGVEKATGKDIAGKIIEFIEKNAKPGKTRTRRARADGARAPTSLGGADRARDPRDGRLCRSACLSDHTPVTMSMHVIHGKAAGRWCSSAAAVHGDEVIGSRSSAGCCARRPSTV